MTSAFDSAINNMSASTSQISNMVSSGNPLIVKIGFVIAFLFIILMAYYVFSTWWEKRQNKW